MSKLAHSYQPTMDELDRLRAIENGDEDLLSDDLAPSRGIFNALLIEFVAFALLIAIWVLWWAALPGITT